MSKLFFILAFLFECNTTSQITEISMNHKSINFEAEQLKLENPNDDPPDLSNDLNNISLAIKNNNPGNIKSFRTGQFRVFSSLEDGYAALLQDLNLKITGKSLWTDSTTTINEFINIYAPSFENDVENYIAIFCSETGLKGTDLLKTQKAEHIARGIIKVEDGVLYCQLYQK